MNGHVYRVNYFEQTKRLCLPCGLLKDETAQVKINYLNLCCQHFTVETLLSVRDETGYHGGEGCAVCFQKSLLPSRFIVNLSF